jgi:hypothetical protein
MSDPLERFAVECGLRLTAEPLSVAPRDVLTPVDTVEQHYLVSLARAGSGTDSVRLIFLTPITTGAGPAMRDVLWWVAGDAWVLEQANGKLDSWAATYGYPPAEPATARLFEQAVRQGAQLSELLGETEMRRLMGIYQAEVVPSRPR